MATNYEFGDADAHGRHHSRSRARRGPSKPIVCDVLAAGDFWGGARWLEEANARGREVQAAGRNMASTDSAVGSIRA
ncbi:MAG: type VII secretion protein EsxI [Mycobacterium sp.]